MVGQALALAAALGYTAASGAYGLGFLRPKAKVGRTASLALCAALAAHVAWFVAERVSLGYLPIANAAQALSLLALGMGLAYIVIEHTLGRREFGAFIVPVAFLFQAVAAVQLLIAPDPKPLADILRSAWFEIHVGTALFSYCAFAIAFAAGLMHVLLFHELRLKRLGFFFDRMPPLDILERINRHAVALGFVCLTVGIVTGGIWSAQARLGSVLWDWKEVSAVLIWLAYAANLFMRRRMGWRGQRAAIFSVVNFALVIVLFFLTSFMLQSHQF